MKRITIIFLGCIIASYCNAQNISDRETVTTDFSQSINTSSGFNFSTDADEVIAQMMQELGLKANFTVRSGKVRNVAATIRHGKRFIEYNPDFIGEMNKKRNPAWTYIFILAHEVGHHLNGHTIRKGRKELTAELEADEFAGFMLRKLGATLFQSRMAVQHISNPVVTSTHPAGRDRIDAVERGWNLGGR